MQNMKPRRMRFAFVSSSFVGIAAIAGLMGLAALFPVELQAQTSAQNGDLPRIGTRFVPSPPTSGAFPLDKSWEFLTVRERYVIRGWYDNLDADDEPPYPVDGLAELYGDISKVQNRVVAQGRLFASVRVDATGKAETVSFYDLPDPALKDVLAFVLLKPKFKPALCKGKACAMDFPVQAEFGQARSGPAPTAPSAPPASSSPATPAAPPPSP